MTHDGLGELRHEQATKTLRRFNPDLEIESVGENISEGNAADLVGKLIWCSCVLHCLKSGS